MANPFRALARRQASVAGIDGTGSTGLLYEGGQSNRLTQDWIWTPLISADQESRWDIARLRARARDLRRNNPYVARFAELVGENVLGAGGMQLQPRVTNSDGKADIRINERIAEAWAQWGEPQQTSADEQLGWADQEWLALTTCALEGEAMVRLLRGFPNDFGFAIQPLDMDLLDHTYNRAASAHENEIRMGVEVDAWGKPVQYWLWTRHPYDLNGASARQREPVPARDLILLRRPGRPGQTRSVTWLAPVLLPLKMLGGFAEAELIAARTAASSMGFYVQSPEGIDDPNSAASEGALVYDAEPGSFGLLPPGITDVKSFSPQHPNIQTGQFMKTIVRWIAGGVSVGYSALGNDVESVNYSSLRAETLKERDHWRVLQGWLPTYLHRRIYREWLTWGLTKGAIDLPARNESRWFAHSWAARGWPWVDPLKEVTANAAALQLSLTSRRRLLAQEGRDLEPTFDEIRDEHELAASKGIVLVDVIGSERITAKGEEAVTEPSGAVVPESDATPDDAQDAQATKALDAIIARMADRTNGHRQNGGSPTTNGNGRHGHA